MDQSIVEVIRTAATAAFMVTKLVTKHFKFEDESKEVDKLFIERGKS